MAILYPSEPDDFKTMVQANCTPESHMAVTDEATYVVMVPIVTSQHRHYIVYEGIEDEVKPLVAWLRERGYKIARGRVELRAP